MKTYYKAIFEDGTILTRSTDGRTYSHAWMAKGQRAHLNDQWPAGSWRSEGFSGSEELARKALAGNDRADPLQKHYTTTFRGVAPAVEITRAEYTELRVAAGHARPK